MRLGRKIAATPQRQKLGIGHDNQHWGWRNEVTLSVSSTAGDALTPEATKQKTTVPIIIIGVLFFIFGFVTWLNGSLIPFLKLLCQLSTFEALLVTFVFYISYTLLALPMAAILARTGYRNGMAIGLGLMSIGSLIHIPAAFAASFGLFLVGLFTLGAGLTILQTASNPYIVLLGPIESAARRISIMGIVNKLAGVVAPLAFTALILADIGDSKALEASALTEATRTELAQRLVVPYLIMSAVLVALIGLVKYAPLPEVLPEQSEAAHEQGSILEHRQLVLGAITLFFYMGLEVMAGDTIGLFGAELGVPGFAALTSYTMACMVLGYILGIVLIPRFISQRTALMSCGIVGAIVTCGVVFSSPQSSVLASFVWGWSGIATVPDPIFFVAMMGLAHALVWPTVWPLAINGLGSLTARGSAILIMSIAGGAVLPLIFGWAARHWGIQNAYWLALPCYAVVFYYGWRGHRTYPDTRAGL
jgi:MFS transporter, FHS family, L-fucose permease